MNIEIANRLVERRRAAGYSQEALAAALGVSRQAVSKWERGESAPDTDNLIALARLYQISLDELLFGLQEEQTSPAPASSRSEEAAGTAAVSGPCTVGEAAQEGPWERFRRGMSRFPYPVLVTVIYLALGFLGNWWHPGWLVFLTIPLYYGFAKDKDDE